MSYSIIKKLTILSVVTFCMFLVVGSIQYAFSKSVGVYIYKLTSLSIAFAIIFGMHFWSTSFSRVTGFQKLLLYLLHVEITCTLLILIPLVFSWFDFVRTIVVFSSFQLVHGAIYLCNMFLYDEKPVHKKTLSEQEIIERSHRVHIDPSRQTASDVGNDND